MLNIKDTSVHASVIQTDHSYKSTCMCVVTHLLFSCECMCLHSTVVSNDAGEKSHAEAEVAAITVVQRPRAGGREEGREG